MTTTPTASSVSTPMVIGTDLVFLPRIERLYTRYGQRFLGKILTPDEQAYCESGINPALAVKRIGARIAVKEAVFKAMGLGQSLLGFPEGGQWQDVEVVHGSRKKPGVVLTGKTAQYARKAGLAHWAISISHDGQYALASAVGHS